MHEGLKKQNAGLRATVQKLRAQNKLLRSRLDHRDLEVQGLRDAVAMLSLGGTSTIDVDLLPPPELQIMRFSPLTFEAVGSTLRDHLVEHCALRPDSRVLEIGSGNGRVASALAGFLTSGSYVGLEIMADHVDWCSTAYRSYPNFSFEHLDVWNSYYNPNGRLQPDQVVLPVADQSFDLVFLTSVFTHMYLRDIRAYLAESARCLVDGGTHFASYFLIDSETAELMNDGAAKRNFAPLNGEPNSYTTNPDRPEAAIAHDWHEVAASYAPVGLVLDPNSPDLGTWRRWTTSQRWLHDHNQDYVVAQRSGR